MTIHNDNPNHDDRSTNEDTRGMNNVNGTEIKRTQVDTEDLYKKAQSTLLDYGMKFTDDIIVRAQGVYLYTAGGQKLLDWTSGQMACILGHGHPEVSETISSQAKNLDHLLSSNRSPPVIDLAYNLTEILPDGLDKVMFLSTGNESCEAAIKLAKIFTGKYEIVGLGSSWHGMAGAPAAAQYHAGRRGYGPMVNLNISSPQHELNACRYREIIVYLLPTHIALSFEILMVRTTGRRNWITVGKPLIGTLAAHSPP